MNDVQKMSATIVADIVLLILVGAFLGIIMFYPLLNVTQYLFGASCTFLESVSFGLVLAFSGYLLSLGVRLTGSSFH